MSYATLSYGGVALSTAALVLLTPLGAGWKVLMVASALAYRVIPPLAWRLLAATHNIKHGAHIVLEKNLPVASGIGGGSAMMTELDKTARLYSVQHLFAEEMIYSPDRAWADMVITQVGQFPKGRNDDLVDTVSMGLRHLREIGLLTRSVERMAHVEESMRFKGNKPLQPLYSV